VGADKTNEMDFKQFAEFMDLLEASMDGEDDEDDEEDAPPAAGKGFGAKPAAPAKAAAAAPAKGARGDGSDSEVMEITKELFDDLPTSSKSRLRGRAQELFTFLAASPALFPPLATADGQVVPTAPARLAPADARPLAIQALIRTAQRALNHAVTGRFARTRAERARAVLHAARRPAEGVELGDFLAKVAHHARRDLWTQQAVDWAEEHIEAVLATLRSELHAFVETV
jgi:hypothetical protein